MIRNSLRNWFQHLRRSMKSVTHRAKRARSFLAAPEQLEDRTLLTPTISQVANIEGDNFKAHFLQTDNGLFIAVTGFGAPDSLLKTDGTTAGTVLLHHFTTLYSAGFSIGAFSQELNGFLYFSADDGDQNGLWRTDGTPAGTVFVTDAAASPENLAVMNGQLYFAGYDSVHGRELWTSDGTAAGTHLVSDIIPGTVGALDDFGGGSDLIPIDGKLYFAVQGQLDASQIWTSDGTAAGTHLVKDLDASTVPGQPGWIGPSNLLALDGRLLFTAEQDVPLGESGETALWISDGTAEGTVPFNTVSGQIAGTTATTITNPELLGQVDGVLYFSPITDDPKSTRGLWSTDGTLAGTKFIANPGAPDTQRSNFGTIDKGADGRLYFAARDANADTEPWVTDGTAAGTHRLADAAPGNLPQLLGGGFASSDPGAFTPLDGKTYFYADYWKQGTELWSTDGTESGTVMVKDILPGRYGSYPYSITEYQGGLLFITEEPSFQLWKLTTDGSTPPVSFPPHDFTLPENSAVGAPVGSVGLSSVTKKQKPTYAITAGNSAGAFSIDPATGQISVADSSQLDFETTPVFTLTVQVTLHGTTPGTASGTVSITLADQPEVAAVTLAQTALSIPHAAPATPIDPLATIDLAITPPASLAGTKLVVSLASGRQSADTLKILSQGTGVDQLQVKGKNLKVGGTTIGTIAGGKGKAANLVVTFNASATLNEIQNTLQQVSFSTKARTTSVIDRKAVVQLLNLGGKNSSAGQRVLKPS
jgi:ELWxxDGT repeat protein